MLLKIRQNILQNRHISRAAETPHALGLHIITTYFHQLLTIRPNILQKWLHLNRAAETPHALGLRIYHNILPLAVENMQKTSCKTGYISKSSRDASCVNATIFKAKLHQFFEKVCHHYKQMTLSLMKKTSHILRLYFFKNFDHNKQVITVSAFLFYQAP